MRMSYLKQRYPIVWDEVYQGVRADCVQAIAPSKWDDKQLERIAYNAACFAVCVHHKQWLVSYTKYRKVTTTPNSRPPKDKMEERFTAHNKPSVEIAARLLKCVKPYIVKRPSGGCQVLFPLSKLDDIVDAATSRIG